MSVEAFTKHRVRGAHLLTFPCSYLPGGGDVEVYDIEEKDFFGAIYPDKSGIAAPRSWFPAAQRVWEKLKAEGKLFKPTVDGQPRTAEEPVVTRTVTVKKMLKPHILARDSRERKIDVAKPHRVQLIRK
jgi:hypothetical protein